VPKYGVGRALHPGSASTSLARRQSEAIKEDMELNRPSAPDVDRIGCPHCPQGGGLDLALRVELETEASIYVAACPICKRVYRIEQNGRLTYREIDIEQLKLERVVCPECGAVGYAMHLDFPRADVECYTVLTCQECHCTFRREIPCLQ
jgi:ribosomal protein S27AE